MGHPLFKGHTTGKATVTTHIDNAEMRLVARLSARILLLLDEHAPTYFDDCYIESTRLQRRIEETIYAETIQFLDEIK